MATVEYTECLFFPTRKTFTRKLMKWRWHISFWRPLGSRRPPCCFFKPTILPTGPTRPRPRSSASTPSHIQTIVYLKLCQLRLPTTPHLSLSRGITVGHQRPKCCTNNTPWYSPEKSQRNNKNGNTRSNNFLSLSACSNTKQLYQKQL